MYAELQEVIKVHSDAEFEIFQRELEEVAFFLTEENSDLNLHHKTLVTKHLKQLLSSLFKKYNNIPTPILDFAKSEFSNRLLSTISHDGRPLRVLLDLLLILYIYSLA